MPNEDESVPPKIDSAGAADAGSSEAVEIARGTPSQPVTESKVREPRVVAPQRRERSPRPQSVAAYIEWARIHLTDDLGEPARLNFEANATGIQNTAQRHPFFANFADVLEAVEQDYKSETGSQLLAQGSKLELGKKSYQSMIEKCFRRNVLLNRDFPSAPPRKGWITSANWATTVNDIVRGSLVCRYLDGPDYLANRLKAAADHSGLKARFYTQQEDNGHYAYHLYVAVPVEIVDLKWTGSVVDVEVEIQLTTQLQDVLRELTHRYYERLRLEAPSYDERWKWEFETDRFKASYLSHALHLLEGLIVEVRRRTHPPKSEGEE